MASRRGGDEKTEVMRKRQVGMGLHGIIHLLSPCLLCCSLYVVMFVLQVGRGPLVVVEVDWYMCHAVEWTSHLMV